MTFKTSVKRFVLSILAIVLTFVMVGCGRGDEELLDTAKERIMLGSSITNLTSDLYLPTSVFVDDVEVAIEWSASESAFFQIGELDDEGRLFGRVTRPEAGQDQAEVTLTATLTYNKQSTTREWTIYIAPMPQATVLTIAQAKASPSSEAVEVVGTVILVESRGFTIQDETGGIYVYLNAEPTSDVKPGAILRITGTKVLYYSMPQITAPAIEVVTPAPAEYTYTAPAMAIGVLNAAGTTNLAQYGRMVRITGLVVKDVKNAAGATVSQYGLTDLVNNQTAVIYNSSSNEVKAELEAKVGEYVSMIVVVHDFHSTQLVWRSWGIAGTLIDAEAPELSDEVKVQNTVANLTAQFTANMQVTGDLALPTTNEFGVTIAWSADPAGIIATDGKFTQPNDETDVTLTAVVTSGDETATFTVVVKAVPVATSTVAAFKAAADGAKMAVEGVVLYRTSRGVILQDATGGLTIDIGSPAAANILPGSIVRAVGTRGAYFGMPQLANASVSLITEAPATVVFDAPKADIETIIALPTTDLANFSKLYEVTGVVVKDVLNAAGTKVADYGIKDVDADKTLAIYNSSSAALKAELETLVGNTITIQVIAYDFHSTQLVWRFYGIDGTITEGDAPELTDEQKVALTKSNLETTFTTNMNVMGDLNLITSNMYDGLTIAWSVDPAGIIATDGTFTAPTVDTTVTLTAVITLNDATETFIVAVLAKAPATISTIADFKAAEADTQMVLEGVVLYRTSRGFIMQDATGGVVVDIGSQAAANILPGSMVQVAGKRGVYFGMPQVTTPTIVLLTEAPSVVDFNAPMVDIEDIIDLPTTDLANFSKLYKVTGVVVKDVLNAAGTKVSDYGIKDVDADKTLAIYNSSTAALKAALEGFVGETITITVIAYDFHSTQLVWRFYGVDGTIEISDEKKVEAIKGQLEATFTEDMEVTGDLALVTSVAAYPGATIVWSVDPAGIITTAGVFSAPTEDTLVTLTAVITVNDATDTFTVAVLAKAEEPEDESIAYKLDFENTNPLISSYPTSATEYTLNSRPWIITYGYINNSWESDALDRKHGELAIRLRARDTETAVFEMAFDLEDISHFTMFASHYSNHEDARYSVFKSTDGGTTWTPIAENVNPKGYGVNTPVEDISESFVEYQVNETGNVRFKIVVTNSTTTRRSISFDDIIFYRNEE